jgi:hypothetical protein
MVPGREEFLHVLIQLYGFVKMWRGIYSPTQTRRNQKGCGTLPVWYPLITRMIDFFMC